MRNETTRINAECVGGVRPCEPGCKRFGSASPPTENSRAGADEAMVKFQAAWTKRWGRAAGVVEFSSEIVIVLQDVADADYSAGRARGIEEERKRCEGIARERLEHWRSQCKVNIDAGCAPMQYDMGARAEASLIADAIAKEGT